ncbi:MAG TPA: hypothetical protein VFP39_01365 [Gemmatimonadales bacterium]|nr:hypothetical protein [Gemmatimonadales bacterium]
MITVRRLALLTASVIVLPTNSLHAQCPDGSPPPCTRAGRVAAVPAPNSVAVLYFDNLSRDSADAYLSDGLTDEVIVRLQHVQRLDVKSRYEVRRFRGMRITDARSAGRDLHVAYLVTGSVRPGTSRMRVSYELVRTADGSTVTSDIVDTTSADPWAISNSVALAIAHAVAGRLAPEESAALTRVPTRDAQAVDLYRRGNYLIERGIRGNRLDVVMGIAFFRAAFERDSTFVDALAAEAFYWGWADGVMPNGVVAELGRRAANRALALDSTSDLALSSLSYASMTLDFDWNAAERLARRAVAANPHSVQSLTQLSQVLLATGRADEAWRQLQAAWAIDSLNPGLGWFIMTTLVASRRYDDLLRWSARVPEWSLRFYGHLGLGHGDSALAAAGPIPWHRVMALAAAGREREARDTALRIEARADSARGEGRLVGDADQDAMAWAAVGDLDRAFAALETSYRVRSSTFLPFIKYWPAFDPLRGDPRYHDLLRRMHLE